jgi:flagellar biosynthesis/type III secretory pathway M-ring protein FliF/YscJ
MNTWVFVAAGVAAAAVVGLLLWVLLRSSAPKSKTAPLAVVPRSKPLPKPAKKAAKVPQAVAEKPSVDIPENASSTRWVGALIDKHPDEAAAVLKRWIRDK